MLGFASVTKVGTAAWSYKWAGTAPFRVYYEGVLLATQTGTEYTIEAAGYTSEPPVIEVLDANDTATPDNVAYPPRLYLQWRRVSGARYYLIQEYYGSWTTRQRLNDISPTAGYYQFLTAALADVTSSQWRVKAVDAYQNESPATSWTVLVVRNPAAPSVSMAYAGGNLTVSSA